MTKIFIEFRRERADRFRPGAKLSLLRTFAGCAVEADRSACHTAVLAFIASHSICSVGGVGAIYASAREGGDYRHKCKCRFGFVPSHLRTWNAAMAVRRVVTDRTARGTVLRWRASRDLCADQDRLLGLRAPQAHRAGARLEQVGDCGAGASQAALPPVLLNT